MSRVMDITIILLFISACFLTGVNMTGVALGENTADKYDYELCNERDYVDPEIIYSETDCMNCNCRDAGAKLFVALGTDADCDNKETEAERASCYREYAYPQFVCGDEDCFNKYAAYKTKPYKYYLGPGGTFVNRGDFFIDGYRTYFTGFDKDHSHEILTDFQRYDNPIFSFYKNSRDVELKEKLDSYATFQLNSAHSGFYFGADPEFGKHWEENNYSYGVRKASTTTGIEISGYLNNDHDALIKANNKNLMIFPEGDSDSESERRYNKGPDIQKGLEVYGKTETYKTGETEDQPGFYFQGHKLKWTPGYIRGIRVLYY